MRMKINFIQLLRIETKLFSFELFIKESTKKIYFVKENKLRKLIPSKVYTV
jgi:hypothetical protein